MHDWRKRASAYVIHDASSLTYLNDWGDQPNAVEGSSKSSGLLLFKNEGQTIESGIWQCTPGCWDLEIRGDELCYFTRGECEYHSADGSTIEVNPNTLVFFESGWTGRCDVKSTMRNTYIFSKQPVRPVIRSHVLRNPIDATETKNWGVVPTMVEGESRTSGLILHKGEHGESETGMWECTPGKWQCHVTRDEFCHFMRGDCTYVHESGEVLNISADTVAFFPKGWKGTCTVRETVRKVYLIVQGSRAR